MQIDPVRFQICMLRKNTNFHFGIQERRSFEELKISLVSPPVLHLYNPELETELPTDASKLYGCFKV